MNKIISIIILSFLMFGCATGQNSQVNIGNNHDKEDCKEKE